MIKSKRDELIIIGAGPAGLTAAITAAKSGMDVSLYEKRADVGRRFNNDFQGLENWSLRIDTLEQFYSMGIEIDFEYSPCFKIINFDANGNKYVSESKVPFYYLIRRGSQAGSFDYALKYQAEKAGVKFHYGTTLQKLPNGGIVCIGPRSPDAIAVGYIFDTDMEDGAYSVFNDNLSAKGYAYLLVNQGRATLSTCLFQDFHNEQIYLEKTLKFFQDQLGFIMKNSRRFGGVVNFVLPKSAVKGRILYAGECAGFQDALYEFGIRYAVLSGYLAAKTIISNQPLSQYDAYWKKYFGGQLKTALVNRYFFNMLGNKSYKRILHLIHSTLSTRDWLNRLYAPSIFKSLLYPWTKRQLNLSRNENFVADPNCLCTWCRHHHHD